MNYLEIAHQCNPNINIFLISPNDIAKKSDETTEHRYQIIPVPNTVKLYCIETQGPDKFSVSNVFPMVKHLVLLEYFQLQMRA